MKKMIFVYAGIVSVAVLIVVAVRWKQFHQFDPKVYTQQYLDAAYKDEYKEEKSFYYLTENDAKKIYKDNLKAIEVSFKTASLSEELENEYEDLFEKVMKNVSYEVVQAKKEKNKSYVVTVQAKPMLLFDDTFDVFQEKSKAYSTEVANAVMKGETMPAEYAMKEKIYQLYYEVLQQEMERTLRYGSTQSVELHIKKEKDGAYSIEKEDIRVLENVLISQEKLVQN